MRLTVFKTKDPAELQRQLAELERRLEQTVADLTSLSRDYAAYKAAHP
jgi:hypothetical protein